MFEFCLGRNSFFKMNSDLSKIQVKTCKVLASWAALFKVVSSAYILGLEYSWHKGSSFIYKINNSGPRISLVFGSISIKFEFP